MLGAFYLLAGPTGGCPAVLRASYASMLQLAGLFALFPGAPRFRTPEPGFTLDHPLACISETVRQRLVSAEKLPVR